MHELFVASDCSQNVIRILFVDFKAFDLIDHNILLNKFVSNGVPEHVTLWSLDFLNEHKQFVKIGESVSSTTVIRAGTPQGTVSGSNDFKLVINDPPFNAAYAKYIDDTTVSSVSKNANDDTLQACASGSLDTKQWNDY